MMAWSEGRGRGIRKEITFTPDEWRLAEEIHGTASQLPKYRAFASFAREMLTRGQVTVTVVRPLTDPEPIAAAIDRIGVNVNQIAHWANANRTIDTSRLDDITTSFQRIEGLLAGLFDDERHARGENG
jgi:hypothetical protein